MKIVPSPFNGSYGRVGSAPKTNQDYRKVNKTPKTLEREQAGGDHFRSWNAYSQGMGSPLPCGCEEHVDYESNKPLCTDRNTNSCNDGCKMSGGGRKNGKRSKRGQRGGGAGSSCVGDSYSVQPSGFYPGAPGPFYSTEPDLSCGQEMGVAEVENVMSEKIQSVMRENRTESVPSYVPYYSQQCQCLPTGMNCAGSSSSGAGCGTSCNIQKGGASVASGSGCSDCQYYYNKFQNYRHMLTGSMYPF